MSLRIGWSKIDITPPLLPVSIAGQFHSRISEGVDDPLEATVSVLDSGNDHVVFVACDLVAISDRVRDTVRDEIRALPNGPNPAKIIFNATHTHAGPETRLDVLREFIGSGHGVELEVRPAAEYVQFLIGQLIAAVGEAWESRTSGSVAYGLDYAVIARNRRWVDADGKSMMYRLNQRTAERFRHIEGYEDHSLNLLATYHPDGRLSGLIVNIPSPSQHCERAFRLSADFWKETRDELRRRLGADLFILPQCSAAGDLTQRVIFENAANSRMLELRKHDHRQEIAIRIADAVDRILPWIKQARVDNPELIHETETLDLPLNALTEKDAQEAQSEIDQLDTQYQAEKAKIEANPALRETPRWYVPVTRAFRKMRWHHGVIRRWEDQKTRPTKSIEAHFVRLGEVAFATNPFEYYLDFGIQIKVRSPATQTFLVQLAGEGSYLPSPRSVVGGGYGSVAASNAVGPEGGQVLAEQTVQKLRKLFPPSESDQVNNLG